MKEPFLVAWSSGKDSTLALQKILETDNYRITLLTTVTEGYEEDQHARCTGAAAADPGQEPEFADRYRTHPPGVQR